MINLLRLSWRLSNIILLLFSAYQLKEFIKNKKEKNDENENVVGDVEKLKKIYKEKFREEIDANSLKDLTKIFGDKFIKELFNRIKNK